MSGAEKSAAPLIGKTRTRPESARPGNRQCPPLLILKCHGLIRPHGAAENLPRIRADAGGEIHGQHKCAGPVDSVDRLRIFSGDFPGKPGPKERVHKDIRALEADLRLF